MTKIEQYSISMNGQSIVVIINRKDNKNTYIRIDQELNIVVNTNKRISRKHIFELIRQNEQQILEKMKRITATRLNDDQIKYLGRTIKLKSIPYSRFTYQIDHDSITLYLGPSHTIETAREAFYKHTAKKHFPVRLKSCYDRFKKVYDVPMPELLVRKMKARHGTCYYHKSKIVLNQSLIQFDDEKIDFVIFHELTHLIHHNHSPMFYETLYQFVPNHIELRKDLNKL